jgi:hypothetical protein
MVIYDEIGVFQTVTLNVKILAIRKDMQMFRGFCVTVGRRYLLGLSGYVIKLGGHAGCHGNQRLTSPAPLKTPKTAFYDENGVFP